MSETGKKKKKHLSVFPKDQDDILKMFRSTSKRYSVCCHRGGKKPADIHILRSWNERIPIFFLLKLITITILSVTKIVSN